MHNFGQELPLYEYKPAKVLNSILETSICMNKRKPKNSD